MNMVTVRAEISSGYERAMCLAAILAEDGDPMGEDSLHYDTVCSENLQEPPFLVVKKGIPVDFPINQAS